MSHQLKERMVSVKGQISNRENKRDRNHERKRSQFKINPESLTSKEWKTLGGWKGGTNTGKIIIKQRIF